MPISASSAAVEPASSVIIARRASTSELTASRFICTESIRAWLYSSFCTNSPSSASFIGSRSDVYPCLRRSSTSTLRASTNSEYLMAELPTTATTLSTVYLSWAETVPAHTMKQMQAAVIFFSMPILG